MRSSTARSLLAMIAGGVILLTAIAGPAAATDLYFAGDIGISSGSGNADGRNTFIQLPDPDEEAAAQRISYTSGDSSPVWGVALGMAFPLRGVMPWGMRVPEFGVPIWPGKRLSFGSEDFRMPEWETRFELQWLGGRDYEIAGQGNLPDRPFHTQVDASTLMTNLRLDLPVQAPITALFGRLPVFEPMTIFFGGGIGVVFQDVNTSDTLVRGGASASGFAWQFTTGIGYMLTDSVSWSVGYRLQDLGRSDFTLVDATGTPRGNFGVDLGANEFTTSLKFNFWHLPILRGE